MGIPVFTGMPIRMVLNLQGKGKMDACFHRNADKKELMFAEKEKMGFRLHWIDNKNGYLPKEKGKDGFLPSREC